MNQIRKRTQIMADFFVPNGIERGLVAAILSVLSVFTFLIATCPGWYESLPIYSELITGVTTFSGYNKAADMQIVKVVLWGIPVFFFVFCGVQNFLEKKMGMSKKTIIATLVAYVLWLVSIINGQEGGLFYGVLLLLWISCYCILKLERGAASGKVEMQGQLVSVGVGSLLVYVAVYSVAGVIIPYVHGAVDETSTAIYGIPAVFTCLWILASVLILRVKKITMERQIALWQIVIPVCLIPMSKFTYFYEGTGESFLLFYSSKYKYFMYGLAILFVMYGVYAFIKQKKGIYVTTVMAIAMLRSFTMPEGILNIDFFHIGEMSTPFMQLQGHGKIPFFDLMPIHGACDYYYSVIDYIFLDNTYLSMNAAMTIGNILLAAFLAFVLYMVCERKEGALLLIYCFVPFIVNDAGIRYIFLCISFFLLFCTKIRMRPLAYVWWYVILSILSITWNMSIGGAGAAAFFPIVLFWYVPKAFLELKELFGKKQKKELTRFFVSYGILFVIGLCYIPLFLQIVGYLKENTGTTLMANGMAMIESLESYKDYLIPSIYKGGQISFLQIFGFIIPFMACLIMGFGKWSKQIKRDGKEFAVVYFTCFYIIANYAFVRFDNGLRTSVLSVIFLVVFILGVQKWNRVEFLFLLLLVVFMTENNMGISIKELTEQKVVESSVATTIRGVEVDDPIVYVTGESVNMKRLGTGFIRGNTLQNLQNLKYVYDAEAGESGEYLDLTNGVANYVFLDSAMVLPYTSGYNISNEKMQKLAIEQLEAHPVDLVVLAPYIRFDEATISLRSPLLYEYLYEAGYKPYVYENVIYMKKSESVLFPESNGLEDFSNLCHKEALQMLPAVWGSSEAVNSLNKVQVENKMSVEETGVTFSLLGDVSGAEIDFVRITIPEKAADLETTEKSKEADLPCELRFLFGKEEYAFTFYGEGNDFLIPVYSSPFWKNLSQIESFTIQGSEEENELNQMFDGATVSFWNF